jgi:hypothetical protein
MCCGYELTSVLPSDHDYRSAKKEEVKEILHFVFEEDQVEHVRACNYMYVNTVKRGNFRGVQFSQMASLQNFLFTDACNHTLYSRAYFMSLIFADSRLSAKTVKIGPHENFPLYGSYMYVCNLTLCNVQ